MGGAAQRDPAPVQTYLAHHTRLHRCLKLPQRLAEDYRPSSSICNIHSIAHADSRKIVSCPFRRREFGFSRDIGSAMNFAKRVSACVSRMWKRAILMCILATNLVGAANAFDESASVQADAQVEFSIPSQPLAKALLAYASITGLNIFYNAALSDGRHSNAVVGLLSPHDALQILLRGTGYAARPTGARAFTIALSIEAGASIQTVKQRKFGSYFVSLQSSIDDAICRGSYAKSDNEILLQLWLSSTGSVIKAEEVGEDGYPTADQSYAKLVRGLALSAPPAAMPQPVNMVIFPASRPFRGCDPTDRPRGAG